MTDPVTEELERRAHLELPWRWAVLGALGIHLAALATLLIAPSHRQRALSLPRVQVRLSAAPIAPAGSPSRVSAPAATPAKPPVPPAKPRAKEISEPPPRHPLPAKRAAHEVPPRTEEPPAQPVAPGAPGQVTSPSGGLALGVGSGGREETFPFTYYLNRVLALIESNWFRPPAPADTHCRVRCVIDRSGRLVEAGLEQESSSAAFDRAALRAVYAAAPLPPLPQGFGGTILTLHLEFGE